ncbi:hypothetical protein [Streptomyces sp. NPDC005374]|uniref:dioxygenase family protein n=1 Tax=Streptomyces sp. NPDC005374 TaxID=3364713 RepID=UPI0036C55D02
MEVSYGRAYAHPAKDGASTWMATGPAYVTGAPEIDNPGVLPMAPDEPGATLLVSGTVRSTSGKPLPGAVIDLWQTTADGRYVGLTPEQAGPQQRHLRRRPARIDCCHCCGTSSREPCEVTAAGADIQSTVKPSQ